MGAGGSSGHIWLMARRRELLWVLCRLGRTRSLSSPRRAASWSEPPGAAAAQYIGENGEQTLQAGWGGGDLPSRREGKGRASTHTTPPATPDASAVLTSLQSPSRGDVLSPCPRPGSRARRFTEDLHFKQFLNCCTGRDATKTASQSRVSFFAEESFS